MATKTYREAIDTALDMMRRDPYWRRESKPTAARETPLLAIYIAQHCKLRHDLACVVVSSAVEILENEEEMEANRR